MKYPGCMAGVEVRHARTSSDTLQSLLKLLAEYTDAERFNLIAYSIGGIVSARALYGLRLAHYESSPGQLKEKLSIGAVAFAAIDVEVDVFLQRLPAMRELAEQSARDREKASPWKIALSLSIILPIAKL